MRNERLDNKEQEKELISNLVQGDQGAFAQLVRNYTRIVYPYLLYWTKNTQQAEELTQDVFLRLWEKRAKLVNVENFGGYLYTITRNLAKAALDKQLLKTQELLTDNLYTLIHQPAPSLEYKELAATLEKAIAALPPRRKEVFLLSRQEEMTYDAIAEHLGISRSAVRQHIVEALVFLRHYIKKHSGIIVSYALWLWCCTR